MNAQPNQFIGCDRTFDEAGVVLVPSFGEAERCACKDGDAALLITIEKNIDM